MYATVMYVAVLAMSQNIQNEMSSTLLSVFFLFFCFFFNVSAPLILKETLVLLLWYVSGSVSLFHSRIKKTFKPV